MTPCPFCRNEINPRTDAYGRLVCPLCANTGRAVRAAQFWPLPPPRPPGSLTGVTVAAISIIVVTVVIMAAAMFAVVAEIGRQASNQGHSSQYGELLAGDCEIVRATASPYTTRGDPTTIPNNLRIPANTYGWFRYDVHVDARFTYAVRLATGGASVFFLTQAEGERFLDGGVGYYCNEVSRTGLNTLALESFDIGPAKPYIVVYCGSSQECDTTVDVDLRPLDTGFTGNGTRAADGLR